MIFIHLFCSFPQLHPLPYKYYIYNSLPNAIFISISKKLLKERSFVVLILLLISEKWWVNYSSLLNGDENLQLQLLKRK